MRTLTWAASLAAVVIAASGIGSASAADGLSVKALPSIAIRPGEPIPIAVSVGASGASGVTAGFVGLSEKQTQRPIAPDGLKLCGSASGACSGEPLTLAANQSYSLWLRGAQGEGVYEGTVAISHAERPSGDPPLNMTVRVSSTSAKAIGVALIAASVVFAFFFTVILRAILNRKQLLIPASATRDSLLDIQARMRRLSNNLSQASVATAKQRGTVADMLTLASLEANGLPSIWATTHSDTSLAAYKAYLNVQSQRTQILRIVVNEGLAAIDDLLTRQPGVFRDADIEAAVMAIEAAARYGSSTLPADDAVRQALSAALQRLAATASAKGVGATAMALAGQGVPALQQVQLEIATINRATWGVVLLLTTGVGAATLVLTGSAAAGFGTLDDYVKCVLWGLGLSAGTQVTAMSSSSIAAAFGIPKAG